MEGYKAPRNDEGSRQQDVWENEGGQVARTGEEAAGVAPDHAAAHEVPGVQAAPGHGSHEGVDQGYGGGGGYGGEAPQTGGQSMPGAGGENQFYLS